MRQKCNFNGYLNHIIGPVLRATPPTLLPTPHRIPSDAFRVVFGGAATEWEAAGWRVEKKVF